MGKRWIDVKPTDWYYRSLLEAERIYIDDNREENFLIPKYYNKFITGKSRKVYNFKTKEGQTSFKIAGYKPDSREVVLVYIDGVPIEPSKLVKDYVYIGYPLSAGKYVSVFLSGVVDMHKGDGTIEDCQTYPLLDTTKPIHPKKAVEKKEDHIFNAGYLTKEKAVCMGKVLKRINVEPYAVETDDMAVRRAIADKDDCYTILNGVLYVSYNLNGFPVSVSYNYKKGALIKYRKYELLVPTSTKVQYDDRFFPTITVSRGEFFAQLQNLRKNLYERFTDRPYVSNHIDTLSRDISDRDKIIGKWYDIDVLNILEEKFLDGCYVFPLYDDDTFLPEVCVTRAECVVYMHRFIEWASERFR